MMIAHWILTMLQRASTVRRHWQTFQQVIQTQQCSVDVDIPSC